MGELLAFCEPCSQGSPCGKHPEAVFPLSWSFFSNDLDRNVTIREFLIELLRTLWIERETFSGKRPFGNSGWDGDLIVCLIEHGAIAGSIDSEGYIEDYDWVEALDYVLNLIDSL